MEFLLPAFFVHRFDLQLALIFVYRLDGLLFVFGQDASSAYSSRDQIVQLVTFIHGFQIFLHARFASSISQTKIPQVIDVTFLRPEILLVLGLQPSCGLALMRTSTISRLKIHTTLYTLEIQIVFTQYEHLPQAWHMLRSQCLQGIENNLCTNGLSS